MYEAGCPFCAIAHGEAEADVVLRERDVLAFLDRRPLFPGHCLVVPRAHAVGIADLADDRLGALFVAVRRVAQAVESAMEAEGSFVAINHKVSQSVPHLHVHVVPRRKGDGLRGFFWPRHGYGSEDEREQVRDRIAERLR